MQPRPTVASLHGVCAEVLRALEQQAAATSFCRLADNVALACPNRSSLITNIMHGGHQSLTGGKQLVDAKTTTSVTTTLSAKVGALDASLSGTRLCAACGKTPASRDPGGCTSGRSTQASTSTRK